MNNNMQIRIIRLQELLDMIAMSKSSAYTKIKDGVLPPSISLGARAVGFIYGEVITVLKAMVSGKSQDEIKAIVQELVAQRQQPSFQLGEQL